MKLHFNKIFNFDREGFTSVTVPFKKGFLFGNNLALKDSDDNYIPLDLTILETYSDDSVAYAKIDFPYFIKANESADYTLEAKQVNYESLLEERDNTIFISTGKINFQASKDSSKLFTQFSYNKRYLTTKDFTGPLLDDSYGHSFTFVSDNIKVIKSGAVSSTICVSGYHIYNEVKTFASETYFTLYKDSSIIDIDFNITNITENPIQIQTLSFEFAPSYEKEVANNFIFYSGDNTLLKSSDGEITFEIDKDKVEAESDNIIPETYVNTFMADYCDEFLGVFAVIKSALVDYPTTFTLNKKGLKIFLIPKTPVKNILKPNVSFNFSFSLLFHMAEFDMETLKHYAYSYELKDIPTVLEQHFDELINTIFDKEIAKKIYSTKRSYGKMSFGCDFTCEELIKSLHNYYISGERCFLDVFKSGAKYYSCHINDSAFANYNFVDVIINYYYLTGNAILLDKLKQLTSCDYANLKKEYLATALHFNSYLFNVTKDNTMLDNANNILSLITDWSDSNPGFTIDYKGIALIIRTDIILGLVKALDEFHKIKPQKETEALLEAAKQYLSNCKLSCGEYYISDFPNQMMTFGGIL